MAETPLIWASGARKEAMTLLARMWASGSEEARERIVQALLEGPPDDLLIRIEEEKRESSRDRRIFDRLKVIERIGQPPIDARLRAELDRIEATYPVWNAPEGERATFATWSEYRHGPDTDFGLASALVV